MSRRNIPLPNEPMPEVYRTEEKEVIDIPVIKRGDNIKIPPATLHGHNLKKIKSFKKLRQGYKISNQKSIFLADMRSMLEHLNTDDNKFNLELLVEVSNIANEFFIYGDKETREHSKMEAVQELLLPYFQNDSLILETMLTSVSNKIKKSTFLRRFFKRVYNFFC